MPDAEWETGVAPDGAFEIPELPSGAPLMPEVREHGKALLVLGEPLQLGQGETREVEWTIGGGCTLRGTLVDQNGRAVAHREVWMRVPEGDTPRLFYKLGDEEKTVARATTIE